MSSKRIDIQTLTKDIEKVSQSYADKFSIDRDSDWFIMKLQEELGELIQVYLMNIGQARNKDKTAEELAQGFRNEVADVFCHILLLANHHQIDLIKEVKSKWLTWMDK